MIIEILNKVLIVLFFLSICNVIRNIFFIYDNSRKGIKFNISKLGLWYLGFSISYILTIIFSGFLM